MSATASGPPPLPDVKLEQFMAAMAAAGNPGAGRHELGMHKIEGWILDYDPSLGGNQTQAVIGVDGQIHAMRAPKSLRIHTVTAAAWATSVESFAERLDEILAFNGAAN